MTAPGVVRRIWAPTTLAIALFTGGIGAATAAAANTPAKNATGISPTAGTELLFQKNHTDPTDSRLVAKKGGLVIASYRAGSGTTKDECAKERGWLPNGSYRVLGHVRNKNSTIKGFAIHVEDKRCHNGSATRTELFVHSEMLPDGGQGGSESTRWDGPRDYHSLGCVKLHPDDIKHLFGVMDTHGWSPVLHVG